MSADHRAQRPQWTCRAGCGAWPCPTARKLFADLDPGAAAGLTAHMLRLMVTAAHDLGVHDASSLYRRFVTWTLEPGRACRACGRLDHDVAPGVPPRLVPWHSDHELASAQDQSDTHAGDL